MTTDPTMPNDETADLAALTTTDAWLDAVGRGEPPPGDYLAEALTSWLTELSATYEPAQVPTSLARRSARGVVAVAVAAVLFVGAGTAAAVPGSPIHRIIFGNAHSQTTPDYGPAERALANASNAIAPLRLRGAITAAQRSDAMQLLADAAAAIAGLPAGPEHAELDAQRARLLRQLTRLRVADPSVPSAVTPAPVAPGAASTMSAAHGAVPSSAAATANSSEPEPSPNEQSGSSDGGPAPGATATASTESTANQDRSTAPQPSTGPTGQDSTTPDNPEPG